MPVAGTSGVRGREQPELSFGDGAEEWMHPRRVRRAPRLEAASAEIVDGEGAGVLLLRDVVTDHVVCRVTGDHTARQVGARDAGGKCPRTPGTWSGCMPLGCAGKLSGPRART